MKANKFFLGLALIGAILTGCENNVPENNGDEAKAYMSVRISMASTAGTRAVDGGFAQGTADEQKIFQNKSIFLFYDATGNWVTSGQLMTQEELGTGNPVPGGDHEDQFNDYEKEAYIVLSGPDAELQESKQVLTVVNYNDCASLKYLSLTDALAKITTHTDDPANAGFLMSTSVYVKDGEIVNTTAIDPSLNIKQDAGEAKAHPVDIYIERASAKAELKSNSSSDPNFGKLTVAAGKGIVVDGVLSDVTVAINGWTLNNVHESTYLVKQLDDSWISTAPFTGWNWAENHRSYWAKGKNYGAATGAGNTVYAYQHATTAHDGNTPMYCYENTVADPKCGKGVASPNVNTVLIAAQFKVGTEDYQNLYEYYGVFYKEATYKTVILEQLKNKKIKKGSLGSDVDLVAGDFNFVKDGSTVAGIKFSLKDNVTYTLNGVEKTKAEIETEINAISYISEAKGYANGQCFYQIPVEHLGAASTFAQYGMVRNHWYEISISKINHVGEPVYDPEIPIPEIPAETQEYYLAAEIHVLSWHVVTQDVEL